MDDTIKVIYEAELLDTRRYMPEKGLVAGVLERAFRDLFCDDYRTFADAYEWFIATESKELYSFQNCIEILELGVLEVKYLKSTVKQFSLYHGNPKEFKKDR